MSRSKARRARYSLETDLGCYATAYTFPRARNAAVEFVAEIGRMEVRVHGLMVDGSRGELLLTVREDGTESVCSGASAWQRRDP